MRGVSAPADDPTRTVRMAEAVGEWGFTSTPKGPTRPIPGQQGDSGTALSGGRISGYESQATLYGALWARQSVQMRRTDGRLAASWAVRKQTALSATWRWNAGEADDPLSEKLARYANEAFGFDGSTGHLHCRFEETLSQMLEYVPVGFRYLEEVYTHEADSDGVTRVFVSFADREPTAHENWNENAQRSNLVSVTQNPPNTSRKTIDAFKMVLFTRNRTGTNYEGIGVDRTVWWPWDLKSHTLDQIGIATDRWANPVPDVVIDREAGLRQYTKAEVQAIRDAYTTQLQRMVAREESVTWRPSWITVENHGGPGTADWAGLLSVVEWCDGELASAYTTEAMRLGLTETGARSVGEVHEQVLRRVVANDLDVIASVLSGPSRPGGGTIGRLVEWSFGAVPESKLPRLTHSGLDVDRFADALPHLPALVSAGLLTPDNFIEAQVRDTIGAEAMADEMSAVARAGIASNSPLAALAERIHRERNKPKPGQMRFDL